ncbi:MAG: hypothetical protein PHY93_00160 [Bacteriovorax sp.]|nr:hypothetical protein [Bacteriovorax sp.]
MKNFLFTTSCALLLASCSSNVMKETPAMHAMAEGEEVTREVAAEKSKIKQARRNDIATEYSLDGNTFSRKIGKANCQITNNVDEFKISQHPSDNAMAYFVKDGDLYVLHNLQTFGDVVNVSNGDCPKTSKKLIVEDIDKYTVVSNINTNVVNLTLSKSGRFLAWDNDKAILTAEHIANYVNNECYGAKDELSFKSYVAFAIDTNGYVYKIKGEHAEDSKVSPEKYDDLKEFKKKNQVCTKK